MTLQHDQLPRRFVKHVVRKAQSSVAASERDTYTHVLQARDFVAPKLRLQTSSLNLFAVVVLLGSLAALFLFCVFVGLICKFANRPRVEARHPQYTPKGMFQPSAAGYGTAANTPRPDDSFHDLSSAKTGLLDAAGPMGLGGNYHDADSSLGSSSGHHASGDDARRPLTRGHVRGASTGVEISAPSAAFRRNGSGQHPPLSANNTFDGPQYGLRNGYGPERAPDGSGFTPGQVVPHGAAVFGSPPRNAPQGIVHARQASLQPGGTQRSANRAYPPSAGSRVRQGRYANGSTDSTATRKSRIDSIGPGTYRKSMYMNENHGQSEPNISSNVYRTPSGNNGAANLRRVDSVNKGDPRRTSRYQGGPRAGRLPSMADRDLHSVMPIRSTSRDNIHANHPPSAYQQSKSEQGWGASQAFSDQQHRSPRGPLGPLAPNGNDTYHRTNISRDLSPNQGQYGPGAGMSHSAPQYQQPPRQPSPQKAGPRPGYPMAAGGYGGPQNLGPNKGGMYPSRPMQNVPGVGGAGRPIM